MAKEPQTHLSIKFNSAEIKADDGTGNEQALRESGLYESSKQYNWSDVEKRQKIRQDDDLHELRVRHSCDLFRLIKYWLIADLVLVLLAGFGRLPIPVFFGLTPLRYSIDSKVLIALLVTTTATVLGLYAIAAKWLFYKPTDSKVEKKPKKEKKPLANK